MNKSPNQTMHVGDQFLNTGNDFAARGACPTVWITNPEETRYILKRMLVAMGISTKQEGGAGGASNKKQKSHHDGII